MFASFVFKAKDTINNDSYINEREHLKVWQRFKAKQNKPSNTSVAQTIYYVSEWQYIMFKLN